MPVTEKYKCLFSGLWTYFDEKKVVTNFATFAVKSRLEKISRKFRAISALVAQKISKNSFLGHIFAILIPQWFHNTIGKRWSQNFAWKLGNFAQNIPNFPTLELRFFRTRLPKSATQRIYLTRFLRNWNRFSTFWERSEVKTSWSRGTTTPEDL